MISPFLRKLSYLPSIRNAVRFVGLQGIARRIYHRLSVPVGGVLGVSFGGCQAKFFCPSASEVRGLELFSNGDDAEFERLLSLIRANDVFFDVGAQYGVYAFLIANALGPGLRVVAFEPFPKEYALLGKNVALNPAANVQILNVALSDNDGEVAMSNSDSAGEFCPRIGAPGSNSHVVAARRCDTLISTGRVPFPNVIKLDVEGHEFAVLRGMSEALGDPRCRGIYCEIHDALLPRGDDSNALLAFLRSRGFNSIFEETGVLHYVFAEKV